MAQTSYHYQTPKGIAGGLYDLAPYSVDSRINGEAITGALKFGMGAVQGDVPGTDVKVPVAADTADKFEGLILTGGIQEMNMAGDLKLQPKQTVGVLRYGKAWARVTSGVTAQYGDPLYLINDGESAGLFTNDDEDSFAVNGRFIGLVDSSGIAPVEIYNQSSELTGGITALSARVAALEIA
jgi:hypothetical protein